MPDDKVVKDGVVEPTPSPEVKPEDKPKEEPKEEPQPQPFNEDQQARIQQMIAEETDKVRRTIQSDKDKAIAEVRREADRKARLAEGKVSAYETSFKGLDEETQRDIELAKYREQDKQYLSLAQEEQRRQDEAVYFQRMNDSLVDEVRTWDIDPEDKGIDFASDAPDYFTGRKRFIGSLQKIVREKQKEDADKVKDDFKNLESKLRKDLGLDSVDTTAGSGGSDSDAEFKKGLGDGSIPLNKTNLARAKKLGLAQ